MDKLLPIVPGCKAIVTHAPYVPEILGKEVYVKEKSDMTTEQSWVVESPELKAGFVYLSLEKYLMRIDGHDEDNEDEKRRNIEATKRDLIRMGELFREKMRRKLGEKQ